MRLQPKESRWLNVISHTHEFLLPNHPERQVTAILDRLGIFWINLCPSEKPPVLAGKDGHHHREQASYLAQISATMVESQDSTFPHWQMVSAARRLKERNETIFDYQVPPVIGNGLGDPGGQIRPLSV